MLNIVIIGPLIFGLIWIYKAPEGVWKNLASRFTKIWGLCLGIMILGAILGGAMMPGGPDLEADIPMLVVGIIWMSSIVTIVWALITTGIKAYRIRQQM